MMYRRYHKLIVDNVGHKRRVVRWYRRHIDENGKVTFKDEPLEKVGTGTYRSARMNSLRLMRTEINIPYHNANNQKSLISLDGIQHAIPMIQRFSPIMGGSCLKTF